MTLHKKSEDLIVLLFRWNYHHHKGCLKTNHKRCLKDDKYDELFVIKEVPFCFMCYVSNVAFERLDALSFSLCYCVLDYVCYDNDSWMFCIFFCVMVFWMLCVMVMALDHLSLYYLICYRSFRRSLDK